MKVVQVKLKLENTELVTWVDFDKRIKKGVKISLRDNKTKFWNVVEVYGTRDSVQIGIITSDFYL